MLATEIMLQYSTENQQIDRILKGITDVFETVFPDRVQACYLRGSYAHGTAVSTSDVDVVFIFKEDFISCEEEERARRLCRQLSLIGSARLDAIARSEAQLLSDSDTGIPKSQVAIQVSIKIASKLLLGKDIREKIPLPSMGAYIRKCMHDVYYFGSSG